MKYLSILAKALGLVVAILLILLLVLAVSLYFAGKPLIEKAVGLGTDLELHIDDLAWHWNNGRVTVELGNILLIDTNNYDTSPVLKANTVRGTIPLRRLLDRQLLITQIYIDDTTVYLDQSLRDHLDTTAIQPSKKPFFHTVIGSITVNNATLTLSGWFNKTAKRSHTLIIDIATLSETTHGTLRNISTSGTINDHVFSIQGSLDSWNQFMLKKAPLGIDIDANLPFLTAQLTGTLGETHIDTLLAINLESQHLDELGQLLGQPLPNVEGIKLSAQLVGNQQQLNTDDLSLSITGHNIAINLDGHIDNILSQPSPFLTVSADVGDLLTLLSALEITSLPLSSIWPWQGDLHITGKLATINEQLAWTDFDMSFKASDFALLAQGKKFTLAQDLSVLMPLTAQSTSLAFQLNDNAGEWRYQYDITKGSIHKDEKTFLLTSHGTYKDLDVQLNGSWQNSGPFTLDSTLKGMFLTVNGKYQKNLTRFDATAKAETLAPLAHLLEQSTVDVKHGTLDTTVTIQQGAIIVEPFAIELVNGNNDTVEIKGSIADLHKMDNYQIDVTINGNRLSQLQQWLSTNSGPIEDNLEAMGNYRSWGSVIRLSTSPEMDKPIPWLQDSIGLLAIDEWLDALPAFDGKTHVAFSINETNAIREFVFDSATIDAPHASANWQGSITNLGEDETMRVNGAISFQADIQANVLNGLLGAVSGTIDLTTEHNLLQINPININSDKSHLKGSAHMVLLGDTIQLATGFMAIDYLDIRPLVDTKNNQANTASDEKTNYEDNPFLKLLSSKEPFNKDWLIAYDYDLLLKIDRLETPWLGLDQLAMDISQKGSTISVNNATATIDGAPVSSTLALDLSESNPSMLATLVGQQINPMSFYILENQDMLQSGRVNANISIIGHGNTMKAVMKTLEGSATLTSVDTILRGTDLGKLSPELSTTLMSRLNPHYKKQKTTEIECAYAHFDIDSGRMLANRSILIITPDINFTATGVIDLNKETMRMQIIPRNRKGLGLSLKGTFAKMAVITGPLDNLQVTFDPPQALLQSATDVAGTVLYGPFYWLVAGQAHKLLASDHHCKSEVKKANQAIHINN